MDAATRAAAAACTEPTAARVGEVLVSALVSVMAQTSTHQQGNRPARSGTRHARTRANPAQHPTAPARPAPLAPKRSAHPVWARSLCGKAGTLRRRRLCPSFHKCLSVVSQVVKCFNHRTTRMTKCTFWLDVHSGADRPATETGTPCRRLEDGTVWCQPPPRGSTSARSSTRRARDARLHGCVYEL